MTDLFQKTKLFDELNFLIINVQLEFGDKEIIMRFLIKRSTGFVEKKHNETKIGIHVPRSRSSRPKCAAFQLKKLKVRKRPHNMSTLG